MQAPLSQYSRRNRKKKGDGFHSASTKVVVRWNKRFNGSVQVLSDFYQSIIADDGSDKNDVPVQICSVCQLKFKSASCIRCNLNLSVGTSVVVPLLESPDLFDNVEERETDMTPTYTLNNVVMVNNDYIEDSDVDVVPLLESQDLFDDEHETEERETEERETDMTPLYTQHNVVVLNNDCIEDSDVDVVCGQRVVMSPEQPDEPVNRSMTLFNNLSDISNLVHSETVPHTEKKIVLGNGFGVRRRLEENH